MPEENNVVKMKLDTLLRLITKQSFSFPISYKDQQNILSSVLQSCLPSTDSSLRIVTDSFCFHCHQYGGFMIRCRWSSCGYMFHPICFHEIEKGKTIIEIVSTDAIVCPLHRNRIQKENGRIQLPKVVKSGYIQKAVVKKSSLLSSHEESTKKKVVQKVKSKIQDKPVVSKTVSKQLDKSESVVPISIQSDLIQSAPAQPTPSQPVQPTPSQPTPSQSPPVQSPPVQLTPVQSPPPQLTPPQSTPIHSAPSQPVPSQSTPSQPVPSVPIQSTASQPVQPTPSQSTPSQSTPIPESNNEMMIESNDTHSISVGCDGDRDEDANDDGEICDICHYGYSEPGDMLVFCEKCNLPVHQSCYGIEKVPEGEWMCSVCMNHLDPTLVTCAICDKAGGAMHRTADNRWVHLICVFYTPELSLNLSGPEVIVEGLHLISKERAALCCCICHVKGGGCIQCSSRSCTTAYHPYCALKAGYILTSKEVGNGLEYVSYCKVHTDKKLHKDKKTTSSVESTPTKKRKRSQANQRKKQKVKDEIQSIPSTILQKITPNKSDNPIYCNDFWNLIIIIMFLNQIVN